MPLGLEQAAVRPDVRRTDFDQVVRLGWLAPVTAVDVDYKRQGGVTTVSLYDAQEVALLESVPALRGLAGTGAFFRQALGAAHSAGSARSLVV
ncbi:hypothetical protein [Streptomyces virginiae]|uniref:hypothetical protein n=1 Tax=Streptomyces virginiae TaxID=1961 RepID=UPI0022545B37|nr:hypothetical protein [Streptomyces virginiae]MCX5174016.1 hypothetical protein [Streptomyces virginiae]